MVTTDKKREARRPLTRERVLEEALRLVDAEGLTGLTLRALGERLGVEAMSLYSHVPGKGALYEGIGELLWEELERSSQPAPDWRESMRSLAGAVRRVAQEHPNAYPLLLAGKVSPVPGLRLFEAQLESLQAAGFDEPRAADVLRAVFSYACGYALMELSSLSVSQASEAGGEGGELDALLELTRKLPADVPPRLVQVARSVCMHDLERQYAVGLEALLTGLEG